MVVVLLAALLLGACSDASEQARINSITWESSSLTLWLHTGCYTEVEAEIHKMGTEVIVVSVTGESPK